MKPFRAMPTLGLAALLFAAAALAPLPCDAKITRDTIKIGVLTVFQTYGADYGGKGSMVAAQMAVDDFGGKIDGKPIHLVSGDTQQKTDVAATIARKWYDEDHVDAIVDVPNSVVALAVLGIARQRHKIMVTTEGGSTLISGRDCSPTVMQWVFDTYNLSAGTARAILKRGGKTWFFMTADFAFGHDLAKVASAIVKAGGGQVLGSVQNPVNTPDLSPFILKAQQSGAKIIGLAEGPPDNFNAVKQGREFGVRQGGQTMVPLLATIADINGVGLEAAQGMLLTTGWYWDMDDASRAWAKRYYNQMHSMPTQYHAGLYSAVTHYLKAVKAADSTDGVAVAAKMHELPVEDFFAKHGEVRPDGRMAYPMLLVQVKSSAESKYPWDYYKILDSISVQDAFLPLKDSECPLVKK